jgi:hypothetical protein
MEIELVATAIALEHHVASDPPGRRALFVAAMWAADDFYVTGVE